jgi:putative ABC transport system permease protein
VAGAGADPEQVGAAVAGLVGSAEVTVSSVAAARAALERAGFNGGLTLVFVAGAAGGALGGVLAVTLALVVQARARGRMLSLLRTMGLSHRQARVMLMIELLPVTAVAVAVGSAVGVAMPPLLAPALALDAFTGGIAPGAGVDATTVVALAGLVVLLVVAGAAVEAALNRRLGLGGVLRVD